MIKHRGPAFRSADYNEVWKCHGTPIIGWETGPGRRLILIEYGCAQRVIGSTHGEASDQRRPAMTIGSIEHFLGHHRNFGWNWIFQTRECGLIELF